jgi:hypothetical protein
MNKNGTGVLRSVEAVHAANNFMEALHEVFGE